MLKVELLLVTFLPQLKHLKHQNKLAAIRHAGQHGYSTVQ